MNEDDGDLLSPQGGRVTVAIAIALFFGTRLFDLWRAYDAGSRLPWIQAVLAGYFAVRLATRAPSARWIAAAVALLWTWFDWSRNGSHSSSDAVRLSMVAADLLTAALLVAGPGVGDWFRRE